MESPTWKNSLDMRSKLWNLDMKFGTWNIRSLYKAGWLVKLSKELTECKLDLVGVQEGRWEDGGTEPSGEYKIFYGKGNVKVKLCP
jgi:hypothetical protein